jgi:hypothetical protein
MTTIADIRNSPKNKYGCINISSDVKYDFIKETWGIEIETDAPGCHGHHGEIRLSGNTLIVPEGNYSSSKHWHTNGWDILSIEDCRQKLNVNALVLLQGRAYNGDYKSLKKTYYLFGKNEDDSLFLHRVRPCVGETGNLNVCREWMWGIKDGESIVSRQGDIAFVKTKLPKSSRGIAQQALPFSIGSHIIVDGIVWCKSRKIFVQNAVVQHPQHNIVRIVGMFELRLARRWGNDTRD